MKTRNIVGNLGLVICLRPGVERLELVLRDIANSRSLPGEVVIVHSSLSSNSEELIRQFNRENGLFVKNLRSGPGLPIQRNTGLLHLKNSNSIAYVSFLDDDVRFDPFYFDGVLEEFGSLPQALAIGGYDKTLAVGSDGFSKILRILRGKRKFGLILKSGIAVPPLPIEKIMRYPCSWFPGHNMNFRIQVFSKSMFSEELIHSGSDVDFLLRLNNKGMVYFSSKLGITRERLPILRGGQNTEVHQDALARLRLARLHPSVIKYSRVILRAGWDCFSNFVGFLVSKSSFRRDRSAALAAFLLSLISGKR